MIPIHTVIIIGAGPAGLTAALYCSRAELNPILFTGIADRGGLLVKTSLVENFPGHPSGILGFDLINNMEQQLKPYKNQIHEAIIVKCEKQDNYFTVTDQAGNKYHAYSIILALGSTPNKLYLPNEDRFWSKGISSCAVCDGALYKRKKIVVVGGGDTAAEEAIFLQKFSDVTLIHRRSEFRASKIMQTRLLNNPKIKIIYNSIITDLIGEEKLERIRCKNVETNEIFELEVDGLFYGLGLKPNSGFVRELVETDSEGFIVKYNETRTSIPGIFVAGDVADKVYRQAITSAGSGCAAALDTIKYLEENNLSHY